MATCPRCGSDAAGNFCSSCGASLGARPCPSCGATTEPGARFCNQCGTGLQAAAPAGAPPGGVPPAGTGKAGRGPAPPAGAGTPAASAGWWVAGVLLVVASVLIVLPVLRQDDPGPPVGGGAGSGGAATGASAVDLSSMTPRQAADRLWTRVVRASEAGDSAEVRSFLPMAAAAYERARPLDADGLFHLAFLQRIGGDFEGAIATAEEGLADAPDHLLLLGIAAEAAADAGDTARARELYGRILDAWEAEMAAGREEYELHGPMMPGLRREAEVFTGR